MIIVAVILFAIYLLCQQQKAMNAAAAARPRRQTTSGDSFLAGEAIVPGCVEGGPVSIPPPFKIMNTNPIPLRTPVDVSGSPSPGSFIGPLPPIYTRPMAPPMPPQYLQPAQASIPVGAGPVEVATPIFNLAPGVVDYTGGGGSLGAMLSANACSCARTTEFSNV